MAGGARIKCKACGDIIQSMYRHDFVSCKCGKIFIDGGDDYTRMGWSGIGKMEDEIEMLDPGVHDDAIKGR